MYHDCGRGRLDVSFKLQWRVLRRAGAVSPTRCLPGLYLFKTLCQAYEGVLRSKWMLDGRLELSQLASRSQSAPQQATTAP